MTFTLQSSAQPTCRGRRRRRFDLQRHRHDWLDRWKRVAEPVDDGYRAGLHTPCVSRLRRSPGRPSGSGTARLGPSADTTSQLVNTMTENICLYQTGSSELLDRGWRRHRAVADDRRVGTTSELLPASWRSGAGTRRATRRVTAGTAYASVDGLLPGRRLGRDSQRRHRYLSARSNGTWTAEVPAAARRSPAQPRTHGLAWSIPITVRPQFTVQNKYQGQPQHLSVRLWVTGGTAGQQIRLNYETGGRQVVLLREGDADVQSP